MVGIALASHKLGCCNGHFHATVHILMDVLGPAIFAPQKPNLVQQANVESNLWKYYSWPSN